MEPRQPSSPAPASSGASADQQYEFRLGEDAGRRRGPASARRRLDRRGRTVRAMEGGVEAADAPICAVKSKAIRLPANATAEEAFRLTLQHCQGHILANVPAVVEARQAGGVHQLRVALRRLRVALAAFGPGFRTPAIEALRMRAKLLAAGLGPARDLDVFLCELLEPAVADGQAANAFAALRERAETRRLEAWDDAVREASGLAFHTFMRDLGEAIDKRLWRDGAQAPVSIHPVFDEAARTLASRQLARTFRQAKKRARRLDSLSEAERHALRIALKKLRYSVEFFTSLFAPEDVKPFVRKLAQMQDILGLLQDVAVARATLRTLIDGPSMNLLGPRADVCFAAGTVYGWHLDRAAQAWTEAKLRWKRLAKQTPFWEAA